MQRYLLVIIFLFYAGISVSATNVDEVSAKEVAIKFLKIKTGKNFNPEILYSYEKGSVKTLYLFTIPDGFIAVSGDKDIRPVIAYSFEGAVTIENMPLSMQQWLTAWSGYIYSEIQLDVVNEESRKEWDDLLEGRYTSKGTKQVLPLCTTRWDQGCYYNELCPYDTLGPCDHAVTGCVATAMAQVMKFWNHPATGTGTHTYTSYWYGPLTADFGSTTYDWASMPDSVGNPNNAVATLMSHCGISVNMDYAATSSSSWLQTAPLINYFSYSPNAHIEWDDWYSPQEWVDLLKAEIDAGRPMIYSGQPHDTLPFPGHAWVVDGYDDSDFFHFNWGWGTSGAYCQMGNYFFAYHNEAIMELMPAANCDVKVKELTWPVHQTFTSAVPLKVKVSNYFSSPLIDIPLACSIDGGTVFRDTIHGSLAPLADTVFTFSQQIDLTSGPGHFYEIKIYSEMSCDAYRSNDTLVTMIENVACTPPLYTNGFEPTESLNGWFTENLNNDLYTWYNYPTGGHTGPHAFGCQVPSDTSANDWLISKCIYLEAGKVYKLSFWYNAMSINISNDISVFLGDAPLSSSMNTELLALHNINTYIFDEAEVFFTVPTDGSRYFGWHCYSAETNLGVTIDDIMITEQAAPDAGVTEIVSPYSTCDLGMEEINIVVRNFSSQVLTNIPVSYKINGAAQVDDIITGTISPGASISFPFSVQADFSAPGDYTIKVFSSLISDTLNLNDTLEITIRNTVSPPLPYSMGFEPAEDYSDWKVINVNEDAYTWNYFPNGGASQPWCARYDYSSWLAADDWIISKCIYLESTKTYRLSFKTKIESNQWPEDMAVYYGNEQTVPAMTGLIADMPGLVNTNYVQSQPQFTVPADGYYYIGWQCYSEALMFNLYLDDIYLEDYTTGIQRTEESGKTTVYPQPFCDEINIFIPDNKNESVYISLENIQGKALMKTKADGKEIKIFTSGLADGIYLLKISSETESESFKVVKFSK